MSRRGRLVTDCICKVRREIDVERGDEQYAPRAPSGMPHPFTRADQREELRHECERSAQAHVEALSVMSAGEPHSGQIVD